MNTEAESVSPTSPSAEADWFLQSLVGMANESTLEIGITLQLSGMLVSGNLVSGRQYFDGFASDFARPFANDPETANPIKESFRAYGEIYGQPKDGEPDRPAPQFVHLKDARFFNTAGNPIPGNKGVWWRGRVCEVGGFSLGSLSTNAG
jgi:hypothetical protein